VGYSLFFLNFFSQELKILKTQVIFFKKFESLFRKDSGINGGQNRSIWFADEGYKKRSHPVIYFEKMKEYS